DMVERPVRHLLAQTAVFKQMALEQMEATWRASEGADCIVAAGGSFSAWCAAEARGIPYRMVLYCPQLVENDGWVPPAFGFRLQPRWMNRLFWRLNSVIWKLTLGGAINQGRARLGLPPAVDAWSCMVPKDGRALIAADPQLTPPEVASSATGALYLDEPGALPERLERFLTAFPSPLYVGFGSMPTRHADEVSRIAVRAAASVGRGVVLSRGWAGLGEDVDAEHVCVVEDVPHATLFPRMAAVVHHGGAGTTHAALAAGVPQL
ncbi:MAG: glycosyltransferase, partial [Myxococcales bacterium]